MTLYTRGYRPYDGGFTARGPRFLPILSQGWRQATRGKAFVILGLLIVLFTVVAAVLFYVATKTMDVRERFGVADFTLEAASRLLRRNVVQLHAWDQVLSMLLVLFVGCGLVADDLKARAFPLYLVRPITPLDYYLGKILTPVCVLALSVLGPGLLLVLLAALFRPTEEMLPFLGMQGRLVTGLLVHFVAVSVTYSSLMLLYSTVAGRRITAIVLGAVTLLGGEILRAALWRLEGGAPDVLRALSLGADMHAILLRSIGREPGSGHGPSFASTEAIVAVLCAVTLLSAFVVLRRARTVEVVA